MFCNRCGTAIRPGKGFCMNCGAPARGREPAVSPVGAATPSTTPPGQPGKRPRKWLVILAAVLCPLLVLGAVLGAMAIFSSEGGGSGGDAEEGEAVDLVTGRIETGSPVEVARQVVPASGGTLTVDDAGSPLKGMRLEVPAGSYPDGREFTISESTITGNTFGGDFEPVLPFIDIDNGGDYSEQFMLLKLPLVEDGDHLYSAFFYDEESGELEGIPVASSDSGGVTLATRHFARKASRRSNRIIVLDHSRSTLERSTRRGIWVRFKPENDGWAVQELQQLCCEGGRLRGYERLRHVVLLGEKEAGSAPPLYTPYNNGTPGFDLDDVEGIKLSTAVQLDVDWDKLEESLNASMNSSDTRNYLAIADDFDGTGKPVFWCLLGGKPGTGHVVVAYKIKGDRVYVYDSNFPGEERYITYEDGKFQALRGFPSDINYVGTWSVVPNKVADRWKELESGTIGDDLFPKYELSFDYTEFSGGVELRPERRCQRRRPPPARSRIRVKADRCQQAGHVRPRLLLFTRGRNRYRAAADRHLRPGCRDERAGPAHRRKRHCDTSGPVGDSVIIERTGEEEKKKRTPTELRRTYYGTGELYEEYYSYFDENGQEVYDGSWKSYLESGILAQDATYVDGKLEGTSRPSTSTTASRTGPGPTRTASWKAP